MNSNLNKDTTYNNFLASPLIPHSIIEYLITSKSDSAEKLWKLLKYDEVNALKQNNLTIEEKMQLRWTGENNQDDFRVFIKPTISDALLSSNSQTLLKIYRIKTSPTDRNNAIMDYEIDFYTNELTSIVEYDFQGRTVFVERTDLMESLFLDLFNGKDLGVGSSMFNYDKSFSRSTQSLLNLGDNKQFFGRSLIMSILYTNPQKGGGGCD